jgi:hypothetical protein
MENKIDNSLTNIDELLEDFDFSQIYDPEMKCNIGVDTQCGQQIIKNYLECLKNGPDSKNIISTKMFYKSDTKSKKLRGKCPICKLNIYSTDERVKVNGVYYMKKCYEEMQK